jgi:5-methylcytosine-specific restriction endonuclease McrA
MSSKTCEAKIQQGPRKGELCGRPTDTQYCSKHIRQTIIDTAIINNIRYCDVARKCFTVLEDYESKCKHCLHAARIRDRKRDDQKRQDSTVCLDCGRTLTEDIRAVGKHDKKLRRCIKCYEKLKKYEAERKNTRQERNYKAEAFKNKYVIWNHYVKSAQKRGIDFTLPKPIFNELIVKPCFYCTYIKDDEVNGIDRIDNNRGYIEDNVVTCCQFCNLAKGTQHPQEFIDKMKAIHKFNSMNCCIEPDIIDKWKSTYLSKSTPNFSNYKKSSNKRNIEFKISEDDFKSIIKNACYLCGIPSSQENKNGIDRFKNSIGYTLENSKPCCGHCNLLKKDLTFEKLIEIARTIESKYEDITQYLCHIDIKTRNSKVEARIKVDNPIIGEVEKREYKLLNEIIIPKQDIDIKEIKEILEKKENIITLKQWKVKQIHEVIALNNENQYKEFCEKTNDISKIANWEAKWVEFILSVKGLSIKDSEKIIRAFLEDLRRLRHNDLCYNRNSNIIDREDRQIWPSTTVLRAYKEGRLGQFKEFQEKYTDVNDAPWQIRWNRFIEALDKSVDDSIKLEIIKKFMLAQRVRVYRTKQIN